VLGGSRVDTGGIFLVLDPTTDGGAAVNELRLHNTAHLSLVGLLVENLDNMGTVIRDLILVPRCIAQRHLSSDLLTIDNWLIMQFEWCKYNANKPRGFSTTGLTWGFGWKTPGISEWCTRG
jgi:hypothetical protein